jgi:hypothetical protein
MVCQFPLEKADVHVGYLLFCERLFVWFEEHAPRNGRRLLSVDEKQRLANCFGKRGRP